LLSEGCFKNAGIKFFIDALGDYFKRAKKSAGNEIFLLDVPTL